MFTIPLYFSILVHSTASSKKNFFFVPEDFLFSLLNRKFFIHFFISVEKVFHFSSSLFFRKKEKISENLQENLKEKNFSICNEHKSSKICFRLSSANGFNVSFTIDGKNCVSCAVSSKK